MATTLTKLAEQSLMQLSGSGYVTKDSPISLQELILAVTQEIAVAVKNSWFQGKNDGINEVNGAFIYSFDNIPMVLDEPKNLYYSSLPSSYVDIPHEMGINMVSFMHSQDFPFVRFSNGYSGLFAGLKSSGMDGRKSFWVENDRIYYTHITKVDSDKPVMIKLAVAFDSFEDDQQINIPPDIQSVVITNVVQRYMVEKQIKKDDINNSSPN